MHRLSNDRATRRGIRAAMAAVEESARNLGPPLLAGSNPPSATWETRCAAPTSGARTTSKD
jgi:hypothetical protein